jgi:hypothetical protein
MGGEIASLSNKNLKRVSAVMHAAAGEQVQHT